MVGRFRSDPTIVGTFQTPASTVRRTTSSSLLQVERSGMEDCPQVRFCPVTLRVRQAFVRVLREVLDRTETAGEDLGSDLDGDMSRDGDTETSSLFHDPLERSRRQEGVHLDPVVTGIVEPTDGRPFMSRTVVTPALR